MTTHPTPAYILRQRLEEAREGARHHEWMARYANDVHHLQEQVARLQSTLGDALDEVYSLRAALAHEALRVEADLGLKSFPKSRRPFAEMAVERNLKAARGDRSGVLQDVSAKRTLRHVGAPETLTVHEFTQQVEARTGRVENAGSVDGE